MQYAEDSQVPVHGYLHRAEAGSDCLILAHGAGSNSNAPLLVALAEAFSTAGLSVLRIDLPFRQDRPTGPPPRGSAERDQQGIRAAVDSMRRKFSGRIFLGGHSYGGRQASMLASSEPELAGALLLLSYPLHPPKQPQQLRTAHFPQLQTPAFFVHGSRDGFGSLEEIAAAMKLIPARTELLSVPSAGHELMTKQNHATLPQLIADTFLQFTSELSS